MARYVTDVRSSVRTVSADLPKGTVSVILPSFSMQPFLDIHAFIHPDECMYVHEVRMRRVLVHE